MEKYIKLSDYGTAFSTREKGHFVGEELQNVLVSMGKADTLILDGRKVLAISYSFADELLSQIAEAWLLEENRKKHITLLDWEDYLLQVIKAILLQRHLTLDNLHFAESKGQEGRHSSSHQLLVSQSA